MLDILRGLGKLEFPIGCEPQENPKLAKSVRWVWDLIGDNPEVHNRWTVAALLQAQRPDWDFEKCKARASSALSQLNRKAGWLTFVGKAITPGSNREVYQYRVTHLNSTDTDNN
ncbi:MAG: hypothetical protein N4J56_004629 [Chroococcidiopsis sp. SAG 2025]|uniref:hypothetical protein n=1 Tax=Chroococcidiopsis sp. SAG 2025 TaxID=171389 RepID=UPI002937292B|nr:hypothetical protein [Chroococcidiopsis sp. SAG 2025]MDV2994975.1 hypothetical protein [Chroococcidiopsis sp. SAG 2025]